MVRLKINNNDGIIGGCFTTDFTSVYAAATSVAIVNKKLLPSVEDIVFYLVEGAGDEVVRKESGMFVLGNCYNTGSNHDFEQEINSRTATNSSTTSITGGLGTDESEEEKKSN